MPVLQGATDVQCLSNSGDGWACMLDSIVAAFGGMELFALAVGGMAILVLYVGSGYHPAPPSIGTFLLGGLLVPLLPPQYTPIAQIVMLMGFITGVALGLRRYFLEPGR